MYGNLRKALGVTAAFVCLLVASVTANPQPTVRLATDGQAQRRFLITKFTPELYLPDQVLTPATSADEMKKQAEQEAKEDFAEEARLTLTGIWSANEPTKRRPPHDKIGVQISFWICPVRECFNETNTPVVALYSYSDISCSLAAFSEASSVSADGTPSRRVSYICKVAKLLETAIPTLLQLRYPTNEHRPVYFGVSLLAPREIPFTLHTGPTQSCTFTSKDPHHWTGTIQGNDFRTAEMHPYYNDCPEVGMRLDRVLVLKEHASKHDAGHPQMIFANPSFQETSSSSALATTGGAAACTFPCIDAGLSWIGIVGLLVLFLGFKIGKCIRQARMSKNAISGAGYDFTDSRKSPETMR